MAHKKKRNFFTQHIQQIGEKLNHTFNIFRKKKDTTNIFTQTNISIIWDYIFLFLIYVFLFSGLRMDWFLKDIIPIGGDIPYHFANYIDLKEILLPNWQISGWSDAGFAGFQLFQSYPIFPFMLIYFFDLFMGSGVAFKTVFIMGAVGLPLAIYWTLTQARIARPGPIFGSILSLAYLFHDDHFAFGGNLRSIFSGEFAHSLSLLLLVIFCGFLFKAFENKKYIPHAILLLALIGFTHPISFAVAFFLPLGFLLTRQAQTDEKATFLEGLTFSKRSSIVLQIMLVSGLFFCTWAIGYYVNNYSTSGGDLAMSGIITTTYGWGIKFNYLIPALLLPFAIAFLLNLGYMLFSWEKSSAAQRVFLWGVLLSMGFFLFKFMNFAVRFLPLLYLFVLLFLAATLGNVYKKTKESIKILIVCIMIASATFIFYFVASHGLFQQYRGTSGYNFMGAESKAEWKSVELTSQFLSENFDTQTRTKEVSHPPRVFSFYMGDLFRVTSQASMYDSLFSDSSFTNLGKWTIQQIDNKQLSVEKFWRYMHLSNTALVIAPKKMAEYFAPTPYFTAIKTFDLYTLFETNDAPRAYVIPLQNNIIRAPDMESWKNLTNTWYGKYSEESPFVVYDPDNSYPPHTSNNTGCTVNEFVQRGRIDLQTDCIGRPLLIKYSYHYNWKVIGAKKIYRTTPSFMLIVPEQNNVTLYYGKRLYNYIAYICGILGIILLFFYDSLKKNIITTYKKLSKKYTKISYFLSRVEQKLGLTAIGYYILERSVPGLLIITLLASIAFVYVNGGW